MVAMKSAWSLPAFAKAQPTRKTRQSAICLAEQLLITTNSPTQRSSSVAEVTAFCAYRKKRNCICSGAFELFQENVMRKAALWLGARIIIVLVSAVLASCGGEGGTDLRGERESLNNIATNSRLKNASPKQLVGGAAPMDFAAAAARFNRPAGIARDTSGNLYVVDSGNHKIRKITPSGVVTTVAGKSQTPGSADGVKFDAQFNAPTGIAVDTGGILYVADTGNSTIRKVTPDGTVTTLAGQPGVIGSTDGMGAAAQFDHPSGIALDPAGNLYVTDTNNFLIRRITPAGLVSTFAGMAGVRGTGDGGPASATFIGPVGITADAAGTLYITDVFLEPSPILQRDLSLIRKIATTGNVTTLAGSILPPPPSSNTDGVGAGARFLGASGIAVNAAGDLLFVADTENRSIRRVTLAGEVTTLPVPAPVAGGTQFPYGIAADRPGNLYFTDISSAVVRRISPGGAVDTIAGQAGEMGALDFP
jgi:sugar lactone lactonase YvrE